MAITLLNKINITIYFKILTIELHILYTLNIYIYISNFVLIGYYLLYDL